MALRFGSQSIGQALLFADQGEFTVITASGDLQAQDVAVTGEGFRITQHQGNLQAGNSLVAGIADRVVYDTGTTVELRAENARISTIISDTSGSGQLISTAVVFTAQGARGLVAQVDLSAQGAISSGLGFITALGEALGSGTLLAQESEIEALISREVVGQGELLSEVSFIFATFPGTLEGRGVLVATPVKFLLDAIATDYHINPFAEPPPPNNYLICDRTGFKVTVDEGLKKEWNGLMVRKESWDPRHPLDFARGAPPEKQKGSPRPEQPDRFIEDIYPNGVTADDLDPASNS